MIRTAADLLFELCQAHEVGRAWDLWCSIRDSHVLQVASPRSESWVLLFAVHKQPDESYCDLFRRIEATGNRIVRATPPKFSVQQQIDETSLFVAMKTLPPDDLHRQLVSQRGMSFMDAYLAFLRTYRDTASASAVESANAVFAARCHRCEEPGHPRTVLSLSSPGSSSLSKGAISAAVVVEATVVAAAEVAVPRTCRGIGVLCYSHSFV